LFLGYRNVIESGDRVRWQTVSRNEICHLNGDEETEGTDSARFLLAIRCQIMSLDADISE